jgi:hypothetical protein
MRLASGLFGFIMAQAQAAAPQGQSDPALHAWFESLRQPQTHDSCCSISNCHFTTYSMQDGHATVTVDGWTYVIPETVILRSTPNPTGRAVICFDYAAFGSSMPSGAVRTEAQDSIEIKCFLPTEPRS